MKQSLRFRFVLIAFCVMLVSGLIASLLSWVLLGGRINESQQSAQARIAEAMRALREGTDCTNEEIVALCVRAPYAISRSGEAPDGDVLFRPGGLFAPGGTLVRMGDETLWLHVQTGAQTAVIFLAGILATALVSVALGTVIAGVISRRAFQPINALCEATEEVARGRFGVRVSAPSAAPQLERLTANFNTMVRELEGVETLQRDFINNVSHEFKTPLSSIHGFACLLQNPDLDEADRAEYTAIIADESRRLAAFAADIVNLSRLENQTILTGQRLFPLDEQLRQAVLMLEPDWSAKGLSVEVELDEMTFYGNEELLRRVWLNLIGNAVKFTPPGGCVRVRLMDADDAAVVRVKDTGIGMSDEVRAHIFEKFYQGDPSHASCGAGLGLAIVRRAVDLCGGTIAVKSEPGQGATFTVTLPAVQPGAPVV